MTFRTTIVLLCIFFESQAYCQTKSNIKDNIKELEPVVVTATAYPQTINNTSLNTTIISQEVIKASHAQSLAELLRTVPGIYVDQLGGRGGISSVYLRGGDPNFTVVLLDGIKLNNPINSRGGSFDFSSISTDSIERIEIVKGPLSALYGSDALSGAINIITKKAESSPEFSIDLSFATDEGFHTFAESRGKHKNLNFSLSASYIDDGEPAPGNEFISPSFIANLGLSITDTIEIQTVTLYSHFDGESFPDDSGGPEFAEFREREKRNIDQFTTGININHYYNSWWWQTYKFGFFRYKENRSSPGVAPGIRDPFGIPANDEDSSFSRFEFSFINNFFIKENTVFSLGIDGEFEDGLSKGRLLGDFEIPTRFEFDRYTLATFAELQLKIFSGLEIILGSRIDFPEDFDSEFSHRIVANYTMKKTGTIFSINWGEGFKLPSFFALGNPIVGNRDLKPETSKGFDIGIKQNFFKNEATGSLTYFYNRFKNLIDLDEGPPPQLVNRSEVTSQGFELEIIIKTKENLYLNGNLSYIDTDIKDTGEELRNRPEWLGNLSIIWKPRKHIDFYANATYVEGILDSSIPTGDIELDGYIRVDTSVTWTINKNLRTYLAVDNLFDTDYEQFVGFKAPGIRPRIGIQGKF